MERALNLLQERRDIIEAQAAPEAQVTAVHLDRLSRRLRRGTGQTATERVVDHVAERPPGASRQRFELGRHILIEGERGAHILMLW